MKISNPNRPLDEAIEISVFEYYSQRITPYLIVLFSVILFVLAFVVLLKYGRLWFSSSQNMVEHMNEVVLSYNLLIRGFVL